MNILQRNVELINPPKYETLLSNVEQAARNCYRSQDKITDSSAEPMIRALIKAGHEAMIEFADLEFMITCDRAISHQLVRHRIGCSYAQESMRYCSYIKDNFYNSVSFIVPYDVTNELYETWLQVYFDLAEILTFQGDGRMFDVIKLIFDIIENNKVLKSF